MSSRWDRCLTRMRSALLLSKDAPDRDSCGTEYASCIRRSPSGGLFAMNGSPWPEWSGSVSATASSRPISTNAEPSLTPLPVSARELQRPWSISSPEPLSGFTAPRPAPAPPSTAPFTTRPRGPTFDSLFESVGNLNLPQQAAVDNTAQAPRLRKSRQSSRLQPISIPPVEAPLVPPTRSPSVHTVSTRRSRARLRSKRFRSRASSLASTRSHSLSRFMAGPFVTGTSMAGPFIDPESLRPTISLPSDFRKLDGLTGTPCIAETAMPLIPRPAQAHEGPYRPLQLSIYRPGQELPPLPCFTPPPLPADHLAIIADARRRKRTSSLPALVVRPQLDDDTLLQAHSARGTGFVRRRAATNTSLHIPSMYATLDATTPMVVVTNPVPRSTLVPRSRYSKTHTFYAHAGAALLASTLDGPPSSDLSQHSTTPSPSPSPSPPPPPPPLKCAATLPQPRTGSIKSSLSAKPSHVTLSQHEQTIPPQKTNLQLEKFNAQRESDDVSEPSTAGTDPLLASPKPWDDLIPPGCKDPHPLPTSRGSPALLPRAEPVSPEEPAFEADLMPAPIRIIPARKPVPPVRSPDRAKHPVRSSSLSSTKESKQKADDKSTHHASQSIAPDAATQKSDDADLPISLRPQSTRATSSSSLATSQDIPPVLRGRTSSRDSRAARNATNNSWAKIGHRRARSENDHPSDYHSSESLACEDRGRQSHPRKGRSHEDRSTQKRLPLEPHPATIDSLTQRRPLSIDPLRQHRPLDIDPPRGRRLASTGSRTRSNSRTRSRTTSASTSTVTSARMRSRNNSMATSVSDETCPSSISSRSTSVRTTASICTAQAATMTAVQPPATVGSMSTIASALPEAPRQLSSAQQLQRTRTRTQSFSRPRGRSRASSTAVPDGNGSNGCSVRDGSKVKDAYRHGNVESTSVSTGKANEVNKVPRDAEITVSRRRSSLMNSDMLEAVLRQSRLIDDDFKRMSSSEAVRRSSSIMARGRPRRWSGSRPFGNTSPGLSSRARDLSLSRSRSRSRSRLRSLRRSVTASAIEGLHLGSTSAVPSLPVIPTHYTVSASSDYTVSASTDYSASASTYNRTSTSTHNNLSTSTYNNATSTSIISPPAPVGPKPELAPVAEDARDWGRRLGFAWGIAY